MLAGSIRSRVGETDIGTYITDNFYQIILIYYYITREKGKSNYNSSEPANRVDDRMLAFCFDELYSRETFKMLSQGPKNGVIPLSRGINDTICHGKLILD